MNHLDCVRFYFTLLFYIFLKFFLFLSFLSFRSLLSKVKSLQFTLGSQFPVCLNARATSKLIQKTQQHSQEEQKTSVKKERKKWALKKTSWRKRVCGTRESSLSAWFSFVSCYTGNKSSNKDHRTHTHIEYHTTSLFHSLTLLSPLCSLLKFILFSHRFSLQSWIPKTTVLRLFVLVFEFGWVFELSTDTKI